MMAKGCFLPISLLLKWLVYSCLSNFSFGFFRHCVLWILFIRLWRAIALGWKRLNVPSCHY
jgi:hypothetical protein